MANLKKFYCFETYFEGLPICKKLEEEGVEVFVGMIEDLDDTRTKTEQPKEETPEDHKKRMSLYKGMLKHMMTAKELVALIKREATPEDSFIFTSFNTGWKFAQQVSRLGIPGLFPTEEDRIMEVDRNKAKEFIRKHYDKVEVAEEHPFKKVDDAIKFLETTDESFVVKGNDEKAPTFVPDTDDPEAAEEAVIKKLKEAAKDYERGGFILEKKITRPIELTPQAWFVDGKLVATSLDIELKRLGASDVGPMTGCGADLVFETDPDAPINQMAFPPVVHEMAKKHPGVFIWDLALLFDPDDGKAYASEFCPCRPGYNAFYTELAHQDSKKKFFELLMAGRDPYTGKVGKFGSSVRIFNVKPSDGQVKVAEGKEVTMTEETERDAWIFDVKKQGGKIVTVASDYQLGVVTGYGDTVKDAAKMAYLYVDGLYLDDKVYRSMEDYLSVKYPTSILNRYRWGENQDLW